MIKLATISPCYNEEQVLQQSIERLTALFHDLIGKQIIAADSLMVFVNDGSSDHTWDIICQQHEKNPHVRGINLARNVGHQNAIMAGMMTAREWVDVVITIDADLQDDLNAIEKMIDAYNEGNEIVYGVKVQRQADPLLKRLSAEAFYKLQATMGVESIMNHADFRLMSRKALDILATYPEHNLYLRGLIPTMGLRSSTVDDIISEREAGTSKYTLSKMMGLALNGITSFSVKPLYYIVYMGLIFLLISLCYAIYVLYALIIGDTVPGWASLILSIWLVGGFILIAISIVGIYIGKIYQEVKGRPLYHIMEVL